MEDLVQLDIYEALKQIADGKRVTRIIWNDKREYCLFDKKTGFLSVHKAGEPGVMLRPWLINDGDLEGLDWIVLEDKPETVAQVVN